MTQAEIQLLQDKLNNMIDSEDDYTKIYEMSLKLDSLIVRYYNELLKGSGSN
ncbi:Spo0E family sporulation regulatory protein-aspartic acid phosphatase [Herbivorax sp. ANBcel31]|uniref:Spo0E family sporulation regulatory protein-aspartic acid phosphatase n=1 Tax=Herbivorax sp. ANBcel31 TaxID=3069754 RepID=UPI0027B39E4C|nr:Spo0E family sporulation regulatory protein-aspartic acid phosphatase [Herbivorax sp. ANBcel31]MDQ2086887.1 Spo0E family sporulation regulatory protein-aspartic acid phosphatase [Herbivorax sp. ANBcel31]